MMLLKQQTNMFKCLLFHVVRMMSKDQMTINLNIVALFFATKDMRKKANKILRNNTLAGFSSYPQCHLKKKSGLY